MHNWWLYTLPFLFIGGFGAFWCLVVKLLSLLGWRRLATPYAVAEVPAGRSFSLAHAYVGSIKYNGVIRATPSEQGLGLSTMFLFSIGHPPLLIPWSAVGPIQSEEFLWSTTYTTRISTADGGNIKLSFTSSDLLEAARPWIQVTAPAE